VFNFINYKLDFKITKTWNIYKHKVTTNFIIQQNIQKKNLNTLRFLFPLEFTHVSTLKDESRIVFMGGGGITKKNLYKTYQKIAYMPFCNFFTRRTKLSWSWGSNHVILPMDTVLAWNLITWRGTNWAVELEPTT